MIVHRFWMGPPRNLAWSHAVIENVLGWPVNDWSPATLPDDALWALDADDPRDISNRVRYWMLARFGGLWLDCDVIPLKTFPTDTWTAAVGEVREGSALCFPERGHPMALELLENARHAPVSAGYVHTTGAKMLTRVGKRYSDVRLEPRVLPYDSTGYPTGVDDPLALHLWETSAQITMEASRDRAHP